MSKDEKILRLVTTGKTPTDPTHHDWKANKKALWLIERTLMECRHQGLGPRGGFALFMGFIVGLAVMGIDRLVTYLGFEIDGGIAPMVALALFAITIVCVQLFSKKPRSYYEKLDDLLNNYSPISVENYRKLQEDVNRFGMLHDIIIDWIHYEKYALALAAGWPIKKNKSFADRKI